jgi:hypothetical protein
VQRQPVRTLALLAVFVGLAVVSNLTATAFASAFGVGLLDLDGGRNLLNPAGPTWLPEAGPERVAAIVSHYSASAVRDHLAYTLTLDILFPAVGVAFGWVASRNLARVLNTRWLAFAGIGLASAYGLSELLENGTEVALLLKAGTPVLQHALPILHVAKSAVSGLLVAYLATGYVAALLLHLMRRRRANHLGLSTGRRNRTQVSAAE